MSNYINVLIHNKRLENKWSLESLSHGICSVSYLSKLEKGTIEPTEDITNKLLSKLDIHLETDLNDILPKIKNFYSSSLIFTISESSYVTDGEIDKLINSIYCLDGLLIKAWESKENINELKDYLPFFSQEQKKKYYQILVLNNLIDYHELLNLFPELDSYYIISDSLYHRGEYAKSIPYYVQYFESASKQCDIDNMIFAKLGLGSVYACLLDVTSSIEEYNEALKLIDKTNYPNLKEDVYYNIAATYIELEQYDKGLEYLSKVKRKDSLYYHKLAICYEKTGNKSKALSTIKKGLKEKSCFNFLLEIVEYRLLHDDYMHECKYETLLLDSITEIKNHFSAGFLYMQENELLKYYEYNRRYKEAYELLKKHKINP